MAKKKQSRRRWSMDDRMKLLGEYEALKDQAEKAAWRKEEGLSTSLLSLWRKSAKKRRPAGPAVVPVSYSDEAPRRRGRPRKADASGDLKLENTILKAFVKLAIQKGMLD